LPRQRAQWPAELAKHRALYAGFVEELTTNPYNELYGSDTKTTTKKGAAATSAAAAAAAAAKTNRTSTESKSVKSKRARVNAGDDPFSLAASSKWTQFYQDEELRSEILKDVKRTYSDFHFFKGKLYTADEKKKKKLKKKQQQQTPKKKTTMTTTTATTA
jgi:hypothetical protein